MAGIVCSGGFLWFKEAGFGVRCLAKHSYHLFFSYLLLCFYSSRRLSLLVRFCCIVGCSSIVLRCGGCQRRLVCDEALNIVGFVVSWLW